MTLPTPVTNSNQLSTEYGLANTAICPNAYYGLPNLPTSGPVSTVDFAGKSNVTFAPDGGSTGGTGVGSASCTLSCSQPAVWTYTGGGGGSGSVDVPSGGTSSSITFVVSAPGAGTITRVWNVTGSAAGVTRSFTVTVDAEGNN